MAITTMRERLQDVYDHIHELVLFEIFIARHQWKDVLHGNIVMGGL